MWGLVASFLLIIVGGAAMSDLAEEHLGIVPSTLFEAALITCALLCLGGHI